MISRSYTARVAIGLAGFHESQTVHAVSVGGRDRVMVIQLAGQS